MALAVFVHDGGRDVTPRVALTWDGTGWHTAHPVVLPDGLELIRLPPTEHRQPLLTKPVINRVFAEVTALDAVQERRCCVRAADRATVQSPTHCPQWPAPIVQ
jgi:hypothetical protein